MESSVRAVSRRLEGLFFIPHSPVPIPTNSRIISANPSSILPPPPPPPPPPSSPPPLPPQPDSRSPTPHPHPHPDGRDSDYADQQVAQRSRWQAVLLEAGGFSAALSEENMRRLKYCLQWLQVRSTTRSYFRPFLTRNLVRNSPYRCTNPHPPRLYRNPPTTLHERSSPITITLTKSEFKFKSTCPKRYNISGAHAHSY
jgi:hypothetical protein